MTRDVSDFFVTVSLLVKIDYLSGLGENVAQGQSIAYQ